MFFQVHRGLMEKEQPISGVIINNFYVIMLIINGYPYLCDFQLRREKTWNIERLKKSELDALYSFKLDM